MADCAAGTHIHQLKKPLDVISLWGMGIASGVELRHFLNASRSLTSFAYVTRRVLAYWRDCLLHGRGMRLVNGNALAAAWPSACKPEWSCGCPARCTSCCASRTR
jgi:hypothetical protein